MHTPQELDRDLDASASAARRELDHALIDAALREAEAVRSIVAAEMRRQHEASGIELRRRQDRLPRRDTPGDARAKAIATARGDSPAAGVTFADIGEAEAMLLKEAVAAAGYDRERYSTLIEQTRRRCQKTLSAEADNSKRYHLTDGRTGERFWRTGQQLGFAPTPVPPYPLRRSSPQPCTGQRHRRAPGRKPIKLRGSRRSGSGSRAGPDDPDGDPEPPAPAPGAEWQPLGGETSELAATRLLYPKEVSSR